MFRASFFYQTQRAFAQAAADKKKPFVPLDKQLAELARRYVMEPFNTLTFVGREYIEPKLKHTLAQLLRFKAPNRWVNQRMAERKADEIIRRIIFFLPRPSYPKCLQHLEDFNQHLAREIEHASLPLTRYPRV